MTTPERIGDRDNPSEELAPISERTQTAALRREVGRCARAAWDALQHTLASFARTKIGATDRSLIETGHACDVALTQLDRLEHALRSLRAELAASRIGVGPEEHRSGRHSFLDALVDRRMSRPPS